MSYWSEPPYPAPSVTEGPSHGYDWETYEDFKDVAQEYVVTEPGGGLETLWERNPRAVARINSKLQEIVKPWVQYAIPHGSWSDMYRTMRLVILSDLTGEQLTSSKQLDVGWAVLDDMLGRGYKPDVVVAQVIRDKFGMTVEEAT